MKHKIHQFLLKGIRKLLLLPMNATEVSQEYPISNLVDGWYFRVQEVSANVYKAQGTDLWNRQVSYVSTNPDEALAKCKEYALRIKNSDKRS